MQQTMIFLSEEDREISKELLKQVKNILSKLRLLEERLQIVEGICMVNIRRLQDDVDKLWKRISK